MNHLVLLIDDSADIHTLVKASLLDEQIQVGSSYTAAEGLELAARSHPDLILLDVDLPDMDGFEVCRRLSADVRTASVPVIFLTAASTATEKVQGLDCGGSDYITKPFDAGEFAARVRAALRAKSKTDALRSSRTSDFIRRALEKTSSK